jgi:hypothetical protein
LALCRTNLADQNPSKSIRYQFFSPASSEKIEE